MATDPVTSPVTPIGQILYGIFLGILTVTFRYLTPFPEGVLTSILTMNMLVMILDKIGSIGRFNFKIALIPFIIAWLLIIGLSLGISIKLNNKETDPNFNIISKEIDGNRTKYVVTEKGYQSEIKAQIVIQNNKVEDIKILEQNDSFYSKIEENNYIQKLKENNEIDTVSGATITSTALKKMIQNTLNDYKTGKNENIINEEKQENYQMISKTDINETTQEYIIKNKGFQGDIKLKVIITNNQITSIEVLEQNDSYFHMLEENNYINNIIQNQTNIKNIDTISGATYSSNGIKEAVTKLLEQIGALNE